MSLHIENMTIHVGSAPAMASALFAAMLRSSDKPEAAAITDAPANRPGIGEYWPGQGGLYAGDFRAGDGSIYGLIAAPEEDIGRARWAPDGTRDLSDWDGPANTKALHQDCPAAKLAAGYSRDEHADFYLPARRELLLGGANLHETFGKQSWYWTSTPYSESYAWAVDFEGGTVGNGYRSTVFRVRPFRRFIY